MGYKVNSYAIFNPNYWGTLPLVLRAHFALCPGSDWQLHIYHDHNLDQIPYKRALVELHHRGLIKLIYVNQPVLKCRAMLWRMIPVWYNDVDYVFCKDADSLMTPRECKIMHSFIQGGSTTLGINDNPQHTIPLMGGMIGFNTKKFIATSHINTWGDLLNLMTKLSDPVWDMHGTDQVFLSQFILPRIKDDTVIYRVFPGACGFPGYHCISNIPDIKLPGVSDKIIELGDKCTNYIGAAGVAGPLNTEIYQAIGTLGCDSIFSFFDKYGNQSINEIIRLEEDKVK